MLGLDIAYMLAKFDHSSFSHFGDMVRADQNVNGFRDVTTPLLGNGIVCHTGLSYGIVCVIPRLAVFIQS